MSLHHRSHNISGDHMRSYEADIYTDGGTRSFRVNFQAADGFDAERYLVALYGAGNFGWLKEI